MQIQPDFEKLESGIFLVEMQAEENCYLAFVLCTCSHNFCLDLSFEPFKLFNFLSLAKLVLFLPCFDHFWCSWE